MEALTFDFSGFIGNVKFFQQMDQEATGQGRDPVFAAEIDAVYSAHDNCIRAKMRFDLPAKSTVGDAANESETGDAPAREADRMPPDAAELLLLLPPKVSIEAVEPSSMVL